MLPYVITGVAIAVALTGVALWQMHTPVDVHDPAWLNGWPNRLVSPAGSIGLAMLVLAWVERSRALLLFTVVFLVVVAVPVTFGAPRLDPPWYAMAGTARGTVLLLGGLATWITLTKAGRTALADEITRLWQLITRMDAANQLGYGALECATTAAGNWANRRRWHSRA